MVDLSVIVISYNTAEITTQCIKSVIASFNKRNEEIGKLGNKVAYEIIVVDNASTDQSIEMLESQKSKFKIIQNKQNVGFSKANNEAMKQSNGEYILFLNSDVIVDIVDFQKILDYMNTHTKVGVLTVEVNLKDGTIDPASHRGFPTIWRSFCYFSGLEKLFGRLPVLSRVFGGYHLLHNNFKTEHEIDSPSGAFFLTRKNVLDKLNGFDEQFFIYGEDLDLAYRIKEDGYSVIYYPYGSITHLKYASGLGNDGDKSTRNKTKSYFYDAMKIFYKKHYADKYPKFVNSIIYWAIDMKSNT